MEFITLERVDFALRMVGNSMTPVFLNNDLVLCANADTAPDGSIATVSIDGRVMLKRVFYTAQGYMLESENPEIPPLYCSREEVKIIGRPVGLERAFT